MKRKFIFISIISFFLFSCTSNTEEEQISSDIVFNPNTEIDNVAEKDKLPKFQFTHKDFDFGLIYQGEKVLHKFKFKNVGNSPLVISDVSATCGCTVPTYSKKPLAPGEEGYIQVKFDSSGRRGMQHKSVTILANTQPNRVELTFVAEIEIPK